MTPIEILSSFNASSIKHFVRISGTKSIDEETAPLDNLLFWNSSAYHSISGNNNYVRFDFLFGAPYINSFKLMTIRNRDPYRWVLEGSKNGGNFVEIYKNDGVRLCNDWGIFDGSTIGCLKSEYKSYAIQKQGAYKSIRLKQTGLDSSNQTYLVLAAIEFTGILLWNRCTYKYKHYTIRNLCFITVFHSY